MANYIVGFVTFLMACFIISNVMNNPRIGRSNAEIPNFPCKVIESKTSKI